MSESEAIWRRLKGYPEYSYWQVVASDPKLGDLLANGSVKIWVNYVKNSWNTEPTTT